VCIWKTSQTLSERPRQLLEAKLHCPTCAHPAMAFRNALRSLGRLASVAPAASLAEGTQAGAKPYLYTALRGVRARTVTV